MDRKMNALDDPDGAVAVGGTSTVTTRLLLQVVANKLGPAGVDRVLERAGTQDQAVKLRSLTGRIPYALKLLLFDAAATETNDPRIGLLALHG